MERTVTRSEEGSFAGSDGINIAWRRWRPEQPRGVVVVVPGFNSHSGYYDWSGAQLAARGLATYAVDLRGRGRSDGERFYVDSFTDYLDDVGGLVDLAASKEPGLPMILLGHSAGGVLACLYAVEHQSRFAGLVCESFAYKTPAPDFALAVLKGLGHVFPHAHVLRLKNEDFSRDAAVVAAMNADPLIANETQPTQTVAELVRADDRLGHAFARFALPLLILHGTADKATRPGGSQEFFDAAGSKDKTIRLYEGHYHDLLNDVGREQVLGDIIGWIDQRIAATPVQ